MRSTFLNNTLKTIALASVLLAAGISHAADVYLQTQTYFKTLPGLVDPVPMWGFICDPDYTTGLGGTNPNCVESTTASPQPQISVAAGDSLTIYVDNELLTPVSVVIPGQTSAGDPTWTNDANSGRRRVQSFTQEVAGGGSSSYSWTAMRAGTYLYQSGTHPSIQVPMGLFGALVVTPPTTGIPCAEPLQAGDVFANSCFDTEAVLLFSEVDPWLNTSIAAAASFAEYPSTVEYRPTYLLVNGELSATLPTADNTGNNVLLRFLNAGLRSHTPSIVGLDMGLLAEDGNPYPGLVKLQNTALLPAGKTLDVLVATPADDVTFALFDRMPDFSNANLPDGGMVANLEVGSGSMPPLVLAAVDDNFPFSKDMPLVHPNVLSNDIGLVGAAVALSGAAPANGTLTCGVNPGLCPDGTFSYATTPNFTGIDTFTYIATLDGTDYSATVTLDVDFTNEAPTAVADAYTNTIGGTITVAAPGVLGNDSDADGDSLTAVLEGTSDVVLDANGSFTYSGTGTTFNYHADDGNGNSSGSVSVVLTMDPASGFGLTVKEHGIAGTPVTDYRWTLEEDAMWQPDPLNPVDDTLATNFHRSYMPVVAQGTGAAEFAQLALDSTKHYYVSVLPLDAVNEDSAGNRIGHTIGGARIFPGDTAVTVTTNKEPLEYAQISAIIFEDNGPTNAAIDGAEQGLGGFQITVEDAGGRYGISAGTMSQDADGNPLTNSLDCFGGAPPAAGIILSCPDTQANQDLGLVGQVLIKNLFPGKYGIIVSPPLETADQWVQTSTIEGTKVIDAWVKSGEPAFFSEFGPVGWHVFVGFVNPDRIAANNPGGANSVSGKVTNYHMARPPEQTLYDSDSYDALAHTRAWVGLNSEGGIGANFAAVQADPDGTFEITNVPDGEFQVVVWDSYLDQVIAYRSVTQLDLDAGGELGNVPVFNWFARLENNVFLDENENGVFDDEEKPISEQAVNLRWRDGSVYQSFPTDLDGFVPFDQVFPFFHWLVAEVDYARFKATGLTVTVDGGGDVSGGDYAGVLNPQIQSECVGGAASCLSRTKTGQVLTQGFQGFLGQTSVFDWGKKPYAPGENGGISGIVYYGVTRAESDPRLAAAEPWEPGIPGVIVRLYREVANSAGGTALALVADTVTDSWDADLPTGCPGADENDPVTPRDKCYDGLRNFNQARPAVFDGGYAFNDIPAGRYVVEVVPPAGYELMKEEDVNVSFGDGYAPVAVVAPGGAVLPAAPGPAMVEAALAVEPGLAQPPCVGEPHLVPDALSLFPAVNAEAPFRGTTRPLCDRKQVILSDQGQAAADFTLFTSAPIAGHFAGMILDDIAQEFNPNSIQFGEKWAPPFVPVSVRDYQGNEISRLYSDQWGRINGLVPSTFTANMPSPSGFSPAMHMTCMNDPGPIPAPGGGLRIDPQYNPAYSNFCYTFQYMPGTTTYLDTPVVPVASFASGYTPADCALDAGTPVIRQVDGTGIGPLVIGDGTGTLTIMSMGSTEVPNPAYEGPLGDIDKMIPRDFGFGAAGSVTLNGTALVIASWADDMITATVPAGTETGQLVVTRANGNSTEYAVTVTVDDVATRVSMAPGAIQEAIDAADPGDLILVEPGVYNESVIMWKPVRLQGAGAGSTYINAVKRPTQLLEEWRMKMDGLFANNNVDALPNQPNGAAGFETSEGAGITVLGRDANGKDDFGKTASRIDGFSITGGDVGGGILVNGFAHQLEIANNHVFGNSGSYHGGIRIGQPFLELEPLSSSVQSFAFNEDINIHHNAITQNGGLGGAGGGLSITTGTDDYTVSNNYVCGNFTTGDGGGIGHLGLSDGGTIANNRIVLNQSFNQGVLVSGGGLFIGGEPSVGALTQGSGNVTVDANFIQGNQAGAGHGGGIRTQFVNGLDIDNANEKNWHTVTLTNNMIVNNVAGWSGAGISLQDTLRSVIVNNTIAHNDSTATVGALIVDNASVPQPAGISSVAHSALLDAAVPNSRPEYQDFSKPTHLANNIVWQNRSFHYDAAAGNAILHPDLGQTTVGECPSGAVYSEMGVVGVIGGGMLDPTFSILTSDTYGGSDNGFDDPLLVDTHCNGGRAVTGAPGSMLALPALDEGGNAWIDVRFGPLDVRGDYHIGAASPAIDAGTDDSPQEPFAPDFDFDNDSRPQNGLYDIGADEVL